MSIQKIRDRLIYADPNETTNQYQLERSRIQQEEWAEGIRSLGLIPTTSGPPARIYGQHLQSGDAEEGPGEPEEEKKKKKKEKGVWYVPWYEDEDDLSPMDLDPLALRSMEEVLQSITTPGLIWDVELPKGKKSRDNFSNFMLLVGISMWREKKHSEDDTLFGGFSSKSFSGTEHGVNKPRGSGRPRGRPRGSTTKNKGVSMGVSGTGRGRGGGESIGGPPNSANLLGRGHRGRG
jgi:hypothetical protein